MARTKQTAKKLTGGKASVKQLATNAQQHCQHGESKSCIDSCVMLLIAFLQ
jgi:hypothetical protein